MDGYLVQMSLSFAECTDTAAIGKSTSARRLHSFGTIYALAFFLVVYLLGALGGKASWAGPNRDSAASWETRC